MYFTDVLKLSFRKFIRQFRRSYKLVVAMSILFCLIFTINLFFTGLRNSYIKFSQSKVGDQVIISATSPNSYTDLKKLEEVAKNEMVQDIEKFGGKILKNIRTVTRNNIPVLPKSSVQNLIEVDPSNAPKDAIPILTTTFFGELLLGQYDNKINKLTAVEYLSKYQDYREKVLGKTFETDNGAKFFVVGLLPGSYHLTNYSFYVLERNVDTTLLNLLLDDIPLQGFEPIAVDNGNQDFWQTGQNVEYEMVYAVFNNQKDARHYLEQGKASFRMVTLDDRSYNANVILGLSPEITFIFNFFQIIIRIISFILVIVATVVILSTNTRLIAQDEEEIALYRSLGATKSQLKIFYGIYFFILIISALIFAYFVASFILILFHLIRGQLINIQAALAFSLKDVPQVFWYGVSSDILVIIIATLLLAPLSTLLNSRKFSSCVV
ncbi:hypothetical protein HG449_003750 [Candidatus Saccharibacteria bacterium]|nr:hypothetical protein [Candidatus Saccharibacteria bacterium]